MKLLIGADPEMFMTNEQGLVRNAHGVIPGTKEAPHSIPGGAIQVDGLALEVNIDPVETPKDFARNVTLVLGGLQANLPENYGYELKSHHIFPKEYMANQPAKSLELGCDPDFNAWTGAPNPAPDGATNLRTAAGHIHFGWTQDEVLDDWFLSLCCDFVKHLDYSLGLYTHLLDNDVERKKLYGKAGAFRPKPYGLEYRTPNNAWLQSPRRMETVFNVATKAWKRYKTNMSYHHNPKMRRCVGVAYLNDNYVTGLINNTLNMDETKIVKKYAEAWLLREFNV